VLSANKQSGSGSGKKQHDMRRAAPFLKPFEKGPQTLETIAQPSTPKHL
jgi:hypothetical protein